MAAITFEIEFILKLEVYSILFIECISKVFICFPFIFGKVYNIPNT